MSDITLVDINELASTISKDKDMLFVVEVPSGGGFIQRKVTKEVMFQLLGNNLDYTTSPGSQDVITFDGPSGNKVLYINNGSTGVMIFKVGVLGVSADGATNIIQMDTSGALRLGLGTTDGTLRILEDLELYEFTGRDLEQNVIVDLDIQDAATTEAVECRNSIAYLEVDAGGTIASHTIQFPVQARVGYTFEFYVKGTVTALTLDGGAATVDEALTTVTDGGGKWVRVVTGGGVGVASWRRVSIETPETQGIPLSGTEVGSPVTGNVKLNTFQAIQGIDESDNVLASFSTGGGGPNREGLISATKSVSGVIDSLTYAVMKAGLAEVSASIGGNRFITQIQGYQIRFTDAATSGELVLKYDGVVGSNLDHEITIPFATGTLALTVQSGDIEITDSTKGIILTSPDSSRWRVTVDNTGALVTTSL